MTLLDRVLALLDDPYQSSHETGFLAPIEVGYCARCIRGRAIEGAAFCLDCRRYLLTETDLDPIDDLGLPDWSALGDLDPESWRGVPLDYRPRYAGGEP